VGTANIAWGAVNLVLVLAVGTVAVTLGTSPGSPWRPLARLVWSLLPISSIILAIVTFWQRGNAYATPAPRKALGAIALAAASLALWLVLRFALDVLPPS
jgi:nucleoside recognition membrane protein YjiH